VGGGRTLSHGKNNNDKYRHKIGLDVALEALRDTWWRRRVTMDDLWRYAAICRVKNVMRPYLESLT